MSKRRSCSACPRSERDGICDLLRLAEELGAETRNAGRAELAEEVILEYARTRNVNRIVLGKPTPGGWNAGCSGRSADSHRRAKPAT